VRRSLAKCWSAMVSQMLARNMLPFTSKPTGVTNWFKYVESQCQVCFSSPEVNTAYLWSRACGRYPAPRRKRTLKLPLQKPRQGLHKGPKQQILQSDSTLLLLWVECKPSGQ
jgi:hypothetical protein